MTAIKQKLRENKKYKLKISRRYPLINKGYVDLFTTGFVRNLSKTQIGDQLNDIILQFANIEKSMAHFEWNDLGEFVQYNKIISVTNNDCFKIDQLFLN